MRIVTPGQVRSVIRTLAFQSWLVRSAPLAGKVGGILFVGAVLLSRLSGPDPVLGVVAVSAQDLLVLLLAVTASSLPYLHWLRNEPLPRFTGVGSALIWFGALSLQLHLLGLFLNATGTVSLGRHFPALQGLGLLVFIGGLVVVGFPVMIRSLLSPECKALPVALAFIGFLALFSPVYELGQLLFILFGTGWFFLGAELGAIRWETRRLIAAGAPVTPDGWGQRQAGKGGGRDKRVGR